MYITMIKIQGFQSTKFVYKYELEYSLDGKNWLAYTEATDGMGDPKVGF